MSTEAKTGRPWNRPRMAMLWAAVMVLLTVGYYCSRAPQANAATQFALTCALVERHTFSIDAYYNRPPFQTIDLAFKDGHYYSDKSPVTSLLGVPAFAMYRWICLAAGWPLDYDWARYFTTVAVVGLAAVLLAVLIAWGLMQRGVEPARAALGGCLWIVATPMLGYAAFFYSYMVPCLLLAGSSLLVFDHLDDARLCRRGRLFASGLMLGLAVWALSTCAFGAVPLGCAVLLTGMGGKNMRERLRGVWGRMWPYGLGGALGVAGYFIYNKGVFGSFGSSYDYLVGAVFREGIRHGFMGAGWPRPRVMGLMTVHPYQGLFLWWPLTALAMAGMIQRAASRRGARGERIEAAVALIFFAVMLLYISGFFMWWGGWAYAPRHLIPPLVLLWPGMIPWLKGGAARRIRFALAVGLISGFLNMAAVAVTPQPDPGFNEEVLMHPESVTHWPSPYWGLQKGFWIGSCASATLGNLVGFYGRASLIPLWILWWIGLWLLLGARRTSRAAGVG